MQRAGEIITYASLGPIGLGIKCTHVRSFPSSQEIKSVKSFNVPPSIWSTLHISGCYEHIVGTINSSSQRAKCDRQKLHNNVDSTISLNVDTILQKD